MSIKPFLNLFRNRQLSAFTGGSALLKPFYRVFTPLLRKSAAYSIDWQTRRGDLTNLPRSIARTKRLVKLLNLGCIWAYDSVISV